MNKKSVARKFADEYLRDTGAPVEAMYTGWSWTKIYGFTERYYFDEHYVDWLEGELAKARNGGKR